MATTHERIYAGDTMFPTRAWRSGGFVATRLPTLRLRAGASLFQCDGESRPLHVDLIAIGSLAQRLQQIYQRLFRIQIFEWARIGAHGVDIFLADDPAEQQLLVRHAWCVQAASHVVGAGLVRLPLGPLFGAGPVENLVFDVRIHVARPFRAAVAQSELDDLVGDFFIALADDDVDGRLATDELR